MYEANKTMVEFGKKYMVGNKNVLTLIRLFYKITIKKTMSQNSTNPLPPT